MTPFRLLAFAVACIALGPTMAARAAGPGDAVEAPSASVAGQASATPDPVAVPFKGTFDTRERIRVDRTTCPAFPHLYGTTTGSGDATALGRTTGSGSDCITPASPIATRFSGGRLTLVATDGTTLRISYGGRLTLTPRPFVARLAGTYTVEGGTGRFANASGGGTITGTENIATRKGRLVFEGTLAY